MLRWNLPAAFARAVPSADIQFFWQTRVTASDLRHRLAAILAADAAAYSRLMAADDRATVSALDAARVVFRKHIESNQGRVIDMAGDSVLAVFDTATGAVVAALAAQQEIEAACGDTAEDRRMRFRIGVHLGDVMEKTDGSVYGDGVNTAARLQGLAEPGAIMISDAVRGAVRGKVNATFIDRGEQSVKNIPEPVRAFKVAGPVLPAFTRLRSEQRPDLRSDRPSLAVLPFTNMSGDPEQEYFADGITEDIITDVSKVSGLFVIARNSSFVFKKQNVDIRDVGRKLGVRHVLEGSVRKAGMTVRINAQLIDVESGTHIWAERYDRSLEDIFVVQDELTRRIVEVLKVKLTGGEQGRREALVKVNAEAYDCLIRGRRCLLQFTAEGMREGRVMLERAIELDPTMALAYANLTLLYGAELLNRWNNATPDMFQRGLVLAQKACEVDEFEPMAHMALSTVFTWTKRLDEAERSARRAIELDANFANGYGCLATVVHFKGQFERAIGLFEQAMKLDPEFDLWLQHLGRSQLALERYDDAEASFRRRLIRMPRSDVTRVYLASLYGNTGRIEQARTLWAEAMEINPEFSAEHLLGLLPYADPAPLERFADGLRKAALLGPVSADSVAVGESVAASTRTAFPPSTLATSDGSNPARDSDSP
jgi:adenylate cyclase